MQQAKLKEYRCDCGKLLFKGAFKDGTVEVKCKSCHNLCSFAGTEAGASESANNMPG